MRMLQQGGGVVAILGIDCEPQAGGEVQFMLTDGERTDKASEHLAADRCESLRRGAIGQQNRELVASEPGQRIMDAHYAQETLPHGCQERISGFVTKAVIDEPQAIEVQNTECQPARAGLGSSKRLADAFNQHMPVGQPGQAVTRGQILDAGLLHYALGDVRGRAGETQNTTLGAPYHTGATLDPANPAIRPDHTKDMAAGSVLVQIRKCLDQRRQVFRVDDLAPQALIAQEAGRRPAGRRFSRTPR
ncbi:hypothetical protein OMK73_06770 [Cupriavidus sp. D39]|nr:hypothetical protein [Cupriavidus sp. D39]MCY0853540.1 hypothetical protein [Cupriavidus sp. D39]